MTALWALFLDLGRGIGEDPEGAILVRVDALILWTVYGACIARILFWPGP